MTDGICMVLVLMVVVFGQGCAIVPPAKDDTEIHEALEKLCQDAGADDSPVGFYFVLLIPEYLTTRHTREKFHNDLLDGLYRSCYRQKLIYQEEWMHLFLVPGAATDSALGVKQEEYRRLMNSFDQGRQEGWQALRTQLMAYDRFRRLKGSELSRLEPWVQDMVRIQIDYILWVDAKYLGYPGYLHKYELTLTLKDVRTDEVIAVSQNPIFLRYRLQ